MVDRIDAGVVCKPLFSEDVQGPKTIFRDRPTRRAIAKDLDTSCILNGSNRRLSILTKFVLRLGINGPMPVAMAGEFVAARVYFSHQLWKLMCHPSNKEKRSLYAIPIEKIEDT